MWRGWLSAFHCEPTLCQLHPVQHQISAYNADGIYEQLCRILALICWKQKESDSCLSIFGCYIYRFSASIFPIFQCVCVCVWGGIKSYSPLECWNLSAYSVSLQSLAHWKYKTSAWIFSQQQQCKEGVRPPAAAVTFHLQLLPASPSPTSTQLPRTALPCIQNSPACTASCVSPALPHVIHTDHTLYFTLHWTEVHCQIRPLNLTVLQCLKPSLPAVHCTPPTCSLLTSPIFASQAFSMHSCQLMVQLWNLLDLTFSCTHFNTSLYWS